MPHASRLRIAVVTDHYSPQSSGGIERVVREIYRRLAHDGHRVFVITALRAGQTPFVDTDVEVITIPLVDASSVLRFQVGVSWQALVGMRQILTRIRPDIINAHGLHFTSSLGAALANGQRRWPFVFTSHVASLDDLPLTARVATELYERTVGRYILERSTRVIAISPSVGAHVRGLGVEPSRIDYVANGVDHKRFHPGQHNHNEPPVILFVGRHIVNKGPQILMESLVTLGRDRVPFRARFTSTGPLTGELQQRAISCGIADRVEFLGHVPDVSVAMRAADILARPSLCEGMPLTLLEGLATGLPIVASDVTGNADVITSDDNGVLVPASDPVALTAALRRLLTDPMLRTRLARRATETAAAYSWEACAAETESVLRHARTIHRA